LIFSGLNDRYVSEADVNHPSAALFGWSIVIISGPYWGKPKEEPRFPLMRQANVASGMGQEYER
jgi:hypothetical protein